MEREWYSPGRQNEFWKLPQEREVQNCSPWLSVADEQVSGGAAGRQQGFGASSARKSKTQAVLDLPSAAFAAAVALKVELKVVLFKTSKTWAAF